MTFKSFLVLESVFIKDYMFSYVIWGNLYLSKNPEIQTYFVLSPKLGTVRKKPKQIKTVEIKLFFYLNIVSYTIKPRYFYSPILIFHFNVLILKQVVRCKWNCTACI